MIQEIVLCDNIYVKNNFIWKHISNIKKNDIVNMQYNLKGKVVDIQNIDYTHKEHLVYFQNGEKIKLFKNTNSIFGTSNWKEISKLKKDIKISYRTYFNISGKIDLNKIFNNLFIPCKSIENAYLMKEYYSFIFNQQFIIKKIDKEYFLIPLNKKLYNEKYSLLHKTIKYPKESLPIVTRIKSRYEATNKQVYILKIDIDLDKPVGICVNACCYIK